MNILFFCAFSLLVSFDLLAQDWKNHYLQNWCDIYKFNGEQVKKFPGRYCQFFDDGSYLTGSLKDLRYLTKDNETKWTMMGNFHHQINITPDGKRILALNGTKQNYKDKKIEIDQIVVLDMNGSIIHRTSSDKLFEFAKQTVPYSEVELTHINSFYEIPRLSKKNLPHYMKEGNFILNAYKLGIFILSPDLRTILHHQVFATSRGHRVHDVQILPSGNYLFLNNVDAKSIEGNEFSSAQELDINGKVVNEFPSSKTPLFFTIHMGGVQALDNEHWLITHATTGSYIYSTKSKRILSNIHATHFQNDNIVVTQQVKVKDLAKFLKHQ